MAGHCIARQLFSHLPTVWGAFPWLSPHSRCFHSDVLYGCLCLHRRLLLRRWPHPTQFTTCSVRGDAVSLLAWEPVTHESNVDGKQITILQNSLSDLLKWKVFSSVPGLALSCCLHVWCDCSQCQLPLFFLLCLDIYLYLLWLHWLMTECALLVMWSTCMCLLQVYPRLSVYISKVLVFNSTQKSGINVTQRHKPRDWNMIEGAWNFADSVICISVRSTPLHTHTNYSNSVTHCRTPGVHFSCVNEVRLKLTQASLSRLKKLFLVHEQMLGVMLDMWLKMLRDCNQ